MKKMVIRLKYWLGIYSKEKYKKKLNKLNNSHTNTGYNDLKEYVDYIVTSNYERKKKFVNITQHNFSFKSGDGKIICYYLPQYYLNDINDKFHGKGFTEWTNATRAIPLYAGHEQPQLPYDLGFYNLLDINTFKRQIELARKYGIYGFCFHYYWFSGKRTMEKPIELWLEHKELDFPFCFNWATENWTALWDGGNNELIFEQKLHEKDDENFMKDIMPYFKDKRYIKIDGKPVLMIYNPRIFGQDRFLKLIDNFRNYAKHEGFPDLYIILSNHGEFDENVVDWGGDALGEFAPTGLAVKGYRFAGYVNQHFYGMLHNISDFLNLGKHLKKYRSETVYRCALPHWDNSPRKAYKKEGCGIFQGTPNVYKRWLKDILYEAQKTHSPENRFIFVNSWNEWAESCHLEPDLRYGYAYLQATKEALEEVREGKEYYILCIESLGDIIACEPIVRYLKKKDQTGKVNWIINKKYKDAIINNPNLNNIIEVECLSDAEKICENLKCNPNNVIIDCHYNGRRCRKTNKIHSNLARPEINETNYLNYGGILEAFSQIAGLKKINEAPIFYIKETQEDIDYLPKKYVVCHTSSSENIKEWTVKKWNYLAKKLIKENFNVIEIGDQKHIHIKSKNFIDLTEERDIQKIAKIIKGAEFFIGIDSAFAHIANALNVYGIILLGKYKRFDFPMPYSGNYGSEKNVTLIYNYGDTVQKLPSVFVWQIIKKIINKKETTKNKRIIYKK